MGNCYECGKEMVILDMKVAALEQELAQIKQLIEKAEEANKPEA